ncbi:choline-sulfatase, partial [Salinivibrio sp. IB574]|uniref:sulfatase-like hydrolase/transferase n=1 Tax=Salinivibrio sp. IB574 TaxID=1909444 RepID=UPI0009CE3A24
VIEELKQSGEFDNTLIVLTGDHGQEMNDNQLNFWGHNSNFTDPQIHVPFAMIGPVIDATQVDTGKQLTSHQDVVPTLMKHYLGVTSDPASYAIGHDLLAPNPGQDWVLSSNYSGYALVTDDTILEVGAGGQYQYMDNTNRPIENASPDFAQMEKALEQISRFR